MIKSMIRFHFIKINIYFNVFLLLKFFLRKILINLIFDVDKLKKIVII